MAARQDQPVECGWLDCVPGDRLSELRGLDQFAVELDRFRLGAELPEDDSVQQPRIALRCVPAALGREHDLVAAIAQESPWHSDLGRVEVTVGQRHEYAHNNRAYPG